MGNVGVLELGLNDVLTQPATDPSVQIKFFRNRDERQITEPVTVPFPPVRRFDLPAFPQENNLWADLSPSRFRQVKSGFFTLTDGKVTVRNPTVMRLPSKWTAQFVPWNQLTAAFLNLKSVLDKSPDIRVKNGETFDKFVGQTFDDITNNKSVLAKAALLNIYTALMQIQEPVSESGPWFSFVRQIFAIDRERFIALVDPAMADIIKTIKSDLSKFDKYKNTPASNHFDGIQELVPTGYKVFKSKMFSIKNKPTHGNIQLTIAPAKDPQGNDVIILDADIDEDGELLQHIISAFFIHPFTGGTHPFDIHEYLLLAYGNIDLGYGLV